ncbi:MAG TPA: hypothetical protein VH280_02705 [Verrucomicrobiae bacterium]|jgi:predicted Co/Zn/Cd cation transporter (cation efflux family)|nr:hypothetical protein [Verrucomicrobiae bacterium]
MNAQDKSNRLSKRAVAFGLSFSVCSVVNAILVIAKEKNPAVQSAMQKLTGHHWITHSAIVIILFVIFGLVFSRINIPVNRLLQIIIGAVVLSSLLIIGFYLTEG